MTQPPSSASGQAAAGPQTEDQQLLQFLQDLNLKVSQLCVTGQTGEVGPLLLEANLSVETLIQVIQTHTKATEVPFEDKLTPPKLVEQATRLIRQLVTIEVIRATQVAPQARAIFEIIQSAETHFRRESEHFLSETLRELCQHQDTVDSIMQTEAQTDLVRALCTMMSGEDTGVAQKAAHAFKSLIAMTQALWGAQDAGQTYAGQVEQILLAGVNHANTEIAVRYYELAIMIASISEPAFSAMSAAAINQVLQTFFDKDALTQMALMDFFIQFNQMPWTATLTAPFLARLFQNFRDDQDVYGLVKANFVVLAASVYAQDPAQFNVFENQDFLWFLAKYCSSQSDQEKQAACDSLHFLFQQKQCLVDFFGAKPQNLELLRQWLRIHRDTDMKMSFLASLCSLLEHSEDPRHSEIVRRLFSNITSEQNFPNPGKDSNSVNLLIELTEVPDEKEELMGLAIIKNLLKWPWGFQAFFANERAGKYLLVRLPKSQALAISQYDTVKVANETSMKTQGLIDGTTNALILQYLSDGVYGENAKTQTEPAVASETA